MTPMRPPAKAVALLWMLASPWQSTLGGQLTLFRRVLVSNTTLMTSQTLEFDVAPSGALQHHTCSHLCQVRPWCDLWCRDTSEKQCLFSDMIVMPGYQEGNVVDALTCYTRKQKDLATGAAIEGTTTKRDTPRRTKENLVDGIYDLVTLRDCYQTETNEFNHWFVLDFGSPVPLRTIKIFSQKRGTLQELQYLNNLQVRIGMAPVDTLGDFSSYKIIGSFVGPVTDFGEVIVIEVPETLPSRYLSVQKTVPNERFQICHLEIY